MKTQAPHYLASRSTLFFEFISYTAQFLEKLLNVRYCHKCENIMLSTSYSFDEVFSGYQPREKFL
jgi:hypothetical protein